MMDLKKLKILFPDIKIDYDASMAELCSFRAGGRAAVLIEPSCIDQLRSVLSFIDEEDIPHIILGNGSNTLFSEGDHELAVIKLDDKSDDFNFIRFRGNENDAAVTVEAGAAGLLSAFSRKVSQEPWSLKGTEGLSGIPGSVGGAVFMNAGAYGYETKDILVSAHAVSPDGRDERDFTPEEMGLSYRHSNFMDNGYIITSAVFRLEKDDNQEIKDRMADFTERRVTKQPLQYPSAGSTFKRPEGYFAGKLIEDAGLKGASVGAAQVSELHAGFVINRGGASADEILGLINKVRKTVYEDSGITLEPEVRLILNRDLDSFGY